jgi:hypothetical protein
LGFLFQFNYIFRKKKFDEAREKPDHSGWLEKKGAKRKNWNKRWFVLKDNYLFYCKGKTVI